ncbi:hypothetical protein AVEN_172470-1 [Araneus ventricosus]|uniref:Uncharacterized protein n=1 Tax=Araneus ventricosus TaxID=182803 RepID=A0A4Y2DZ40_ARAVE|nr:hypothetical protein AVEN_172470-1 [Araneus ventricosus]
MYPLENKSNTLQEFKIRHLIHSCQIPTQLPVTLGYDTNVPKRGAIRLQNYAAITPAIGAIFGKITPAAVYPGPLTRPAPWTRNGSFYGKLEALINIRKFLQQTKRGRAIQYQKEAEPLPSSCLMR